MTNREILENLDYENLVVFDNPDFDDAIVGVSHDDRVIYDYNKMVQHIMREWSVDTEEAQDFISYNTIRSLSYVGGDAPIVMFDIEQYS